MRKSGKRKNKSENAEKMGSNIYRYGKKSTVRVQYAVHDNNIVVVVGLVQ